MSTTTRPTTRQLANRLLSTLDWLANQQDTLPGGWVMKSYPDDLPVEIYWATAFNDADSLLGALAYLRQQFGAGVSSNSPSWVSWPPEGDRPRLTVHLGGAA